MKAETGYVVEDGIGSKEWRADVNCGRRDPQVIGVDRPVQWVSGLSARMAQLGCGREQGVADRHDADNWPESRRWDGCTFLLAGFRHNPEPLWRGVASRVSVAATSSATRPAASPTSSQRTPSSMLSHRQCSSDDAPRAS